jgi:hypothetical protein
VLKKKKRKKKTTKERSEYQKMSKKSDQPATSAQHDSSPARHSLLAAKEMAAQVNTFEDGDDIEEHLRRLDDMAELMMVDETVKYQAMLLSLNDTTRTEFNAWLKTERLKEEVRGKPDALKKRLLEKFRVRQSVLERINFIIQPRRREQRLVVDLLERQRVYTHVLEELMKNREKLLVEASMQLLSPDDRADYCNFRPNEANREMGDLIEFVRRKEEERLREEKIGTTTEKKKKKKQQKEEPTEEEDDKEEAEGKKKKERKKEKEDEGKKMIIPTKKKKKRVYIEEEDERERLMAQGRCFICHKIGHIAMDCPENARNQAEATKKKISASRRSDSHSF